MINYICPNADKQTMYVSTNVFTNVTNVYLCNISNLVWKFIAKYFRERRNPAYSDKLISQAIFKENKVQMMIFFRQVIA
jgi:hypothetical protein